MTITWKDGRIIALMAAVLVILSCINVHAAGSSVKLKAYTVPKTLNAGQQFSVKGKIKAAKKIKKVEVGIVNKKTGKWTKYKYTKKNINKKSFDLKNADAKLKFGKLKSGEYRYRVRVQLYGKKAKNYLNKPFKVVDLGIDPGMLDGADTEGITLVNCAAPKDFGVGTSFTPSGTVNTTSTINKVEVGIVFEPTNKWTAYKYTSNTETKSFDLSSAASKLKFSKLAGGTFRYRMYVHTDDGVKIAFNKRFTVTPSEKPQQAVDWAVNIANDDSFSYGEKPETSRNGCYFCGTNQKKKPEGFEKTYVCSTFVHAAYAHGAGDPELLRDCQSGKYCLSLTDSNMRNYSCWMKVGLCKDLTVEDLQPGDVICAYAPSNYGGHLALYAGENTIVDAQGLGDGWGANTIAVRENYAQKMLNYAKNHHSQSYVMRYNK